LPDDGPLEAKGWAEQCQVFYPLPEPSPDEEEYLPDVDTAAADDGWEPF